MTIKLIDERPSWSLRLQGTPTTPRQSLARTAFKNFIVLNSVSARTSTFVPWVHRFGTVPNNLQAKSDGLAYPLPRHTRKLHGTRHSP